MSLPMTSSPDSEPLLMSTKENCFEEVDPRERGWRGQQLIEWIDESFIESCGFSPALEGSRAVMVILTMLCHIHGKQPAADILGTVGVAAFLVLSGFLVTGMLIKSIRKVQATEPTTSFAHIKTSLSHLPLFYADRLFRLTPPLVLCVSIVSSYWYYIGHPFEHVSYYFWRALLNIENTQFWRKPQYPPTPFGNYWSLALEEQYYAIWSLLFPFVYRLQVRHRLYLLSIIIILSLTTRLVTYYHPGSFGGFHWHFSFPTNVYKLFLGSLLRLVPLPRSFFSHVVGYIALIALLALSAGAYATFWDRQAWSDPLAALFSVFLITGCLRGNRILEWQWLRFLGRVSYSWYIWQIPILVTTGYMGKNYPALTDTCLALIVATISTLYVEEPIRNWWRRSRPA